MLTIRLVTLKPYKYKTLTFSESDGVISTVIASINHLTAIIYI